jgi:DNA modification methylase
MTQDAARSRLQGFVLPTPYYERDGITIYHGDCRRILPGLEFDMVFTDPPYGVGFSYSAFNDADKIGFCRLISEVVDIVQSSGKPMAITTGINWMWSYPPADGVMCWFKPGSVRHSTLGTISEWEPVLIYGKLPGKSRFGSDVIRLPDCTSHAKDEAGGHPCPKPLGLYRQLLARFDTARFCDPFMGSGTTLLAARLEGKTAVGCEVDERYCEIAAKRLSQGVLF